MTTLVGLEEKQILVDFVCGYFSKPAGGNRSNRLDSNPMQSSLSRCTSLTCVCLRLILKFDMFDVNQIGSCIRLILKFDMFDVNQIGSCIRVT